MPDRISCAATDCTKQARSSRSGAYCDVHYQRLRKTGSLILKERPKVCAVEGCARSVTALGYCNPHYRKLKRHGDAEYAPKTFEVCQVDGCERVPHTPRAEWCTAHYNRLYRTGSLMEGVPVRPWHTGVVPEQEYLRTHVAITHPLAGRSTRVLVHRVVLFDAIGPGVHACHWCSGSVTWDRSFPGHPDGLTVDHLDGDKHNNAPANLVPSCGSCNAHRAGLRLV